MIAKETWARVSSMAQTGYYPVMCQTIINEEETPWEKRNYIPDKQIKNCDTQEKVAESHI